VISERIKIPARVARMITDLCLLKFIYTKSGKQKSPVINGITSLSHHADKIAPAKRNMLN
jgi:hypothetical protein